MTDPTTIDSSHSTNHTPIHLAPPTAAWTSPYRLHAFVMALVVILDILRAVPGRTRLPQQESQQLPYVWGSGFQRGFSNLCFGARTVGHLVQEITDERVRGCRAVEVGQALWGEEMTQVESMGDEQAHELRPVIEQGVHERGFQISGLG